jgi:hypothetical protein
MQVNAMGKASIFYDWMDKAVRTSGLRLAPNGATVSDMLEARKHAIESVSASQRADAELAACADVHRLIKVVLPKFSLDRGFEFSNAVKLGERQCFLQSFIIAGLLQRMGIDAGVEMVYANERGEETNNGHAVTLVKLQNGHDIIVDASEPTPFAHHQGLFVKIPAYRYVMPVYEITTGQIVYYRAAGGDARLPVARVRTLGLDFLGSQFWYYRGERAPGGLLLSPRTTTGLKAAEHCLRMSVRTCPSNPLAVYMLGRVFLAEGNKAEAKKYIDSAYKLYKDFGWIPQGEREYYLRMK